MRPFSYISIVFLCAVIPSIWLVAQGMLSMWCPIAMGIIYLGLLVVGSVKIQWNFYLFSFNKGSSGSQYIALTFDDGPNTETEAVLDILQEEQVPAAFFCIGKHVEQQPGLVKRMYEEGHIVGNHSNRHANTFDIQSAAKMQQEIAVCNQSIAAIIGKTPRLFRPPYGVTNPNLATAVSKTKMHSVGWSIRSFDTNARDASKLLDSITQQLKGGSIVLLHDHVALTTEILTELIHTARQKGFTFVRIDQLLDIDAYT